MSLLVSWLGIQGSSTLTSWWFHDGWISFVNYFNQLWTSHFTCMGSTASIQQTAIHSTINFEGAAHLSHKASTTWLVQTSWDLIDKVSSIHDVRFSWRWINVIFWHRLVFLGLWQRSYRSYLSRKVIVLWESCAFNLQSQYSKWDWFTNSNGNSHSMTQRQWRSYAWIHIDSRQLHA